MSRHKSYRLRDESRLIRFHRERSDRAIEREAATMAAEVECVICGHGPHEDGKCNRYMKISWPQRICDCPTYVPDDDEGEL